MLAEIFIANTYPLPNLRLNSIKNKKKGHKFRTELFFNFELEKTFLRFSKKMMNAKKNKKKKDDFWNQIFKNSRT